MAHRAIAQPRTDQALCDPARTWMASLVGGSCQPGSLLLTMLYLQLHHRCSCITGAQECTEQPEL
jgi:hypothetical protein